MFRAVCAGACVLLLCGMAMAADSPVDKGSLYLNGMAFFQSQSGDLYENGDGDALVSYGVGDASLGFLQSFEVSPTVGYFVSPGVFLGAQAAFVGYSQGDNDLTGFALGPTIGYFFDTDPARTEIKGAVYPYIRGFFTWGQLSEDSYDLTILQYGGRGGLLYMLSSAVAADANVRFQGDSWKPEGASESTTGTTLAIGVGITAFIY